MALSGMFAGVMYTNVAFVFSLLKVRAQHDKRHNIRYREEISRIYRVEGVHGFFNGYSAMLLRDAPGFAWYFFSYEFLKRYLASSDKQDSSIRSKLWISLAGGLAGVSSWLITYPADLLKTRLQTAKSGCNLGVFGLAN